MTKTTEYISYEEGIAALSALFAGKSVPEALAAATFVRDNILGRDLSFEEQLDVIWTFIHVG